MVLLVILKILYKFANKKIATIKKNNFQYKILYIIAHTTQHTRIRFFATWFTYYLSIVAIIYLLFIYWYALKKRCYKH